MSNYFSAKVKIDNNTNIYNFETIFFKNISTIGLLDDYQIEIADGYDAPDGFIQSINPNNYVIYNIEKVLWETDDGFYYNSFDCKHRFQTSGKHFIKLKIWSEPIYEIYNGVLVKFYFTTSTIFNFVLESYFLKLLTSYHPTWNIIKNKPFEDFLKSIANLYEKIFVECTSLYNLWDVENIDPKYLEYLSLTLGHNYSYTKKISINTAIDNFEEYDIFDKIKKNLATPREIYNFRKFLLFSSELFRKKGSSLSIEKFFSFFDLKSKVVNLWTDTWGLESIGKIEENFVDFHFENNYHTFVYDTKVLGMCNGGFFKKKLASFMIDNFHKMEKVVYPKHCVNVITNNTSPKNGWCEIPIQYGPEYVLDIRKENGDIFTDPFNYYHEPHFYDIVPFNITGNPEVSGNALLQIDPNVIENGEKISILYKLSDDDIYDTGVISKYNQFKDLDIEVQFRFHRPQEPNINESFKKANNEIFVIFRGQKNLIQRNNISVNAYYKLTVNGLSKYVCLSKITESSNGVFYEQLLNISNDAKNPIYKKLLNVFSDNENCVNELFEYEILHKLKVYINGSVVSAYLEKLDNHTKILNNIEHNIGENYFKQPSCLESITLFENVSLDQKEFEILSLDQKGDTIANIPYQPLFEKGFYGFGCRNSILEIFEYNINVFDEREHLYNDKNKAIYLKSNYLDYYQVPELKFNSSYEYKNSNYYTKVIVDSYNPEKQEIFTNTRSLVDLYFDDTVITEQLGTRYTITFDEEWLKENFSSNEEVEKKIIIPFGNQLSWFMPDIPWVNKSIYKPFSSNIPLGLFKYNLNPILDTYDLEPEDSFSALNRISDLEFSLSQRLIEYLMGKNNFGFKGVFQEVCPLSYNFGKEYVTKDIELVDGTYFENPMFQPVVTKGNNGYRIIGVRFRNCDDIERLLTINSTSLYKNVYLFGHFSMELPEEAIQYAPNAYLVKKENNKYIADFFLPLGILHKNNRVYTLNTNFLKIYENSGLDTLTLKGVYVRNPKDKIIFNPTNFTIKLDESLKNPYEDKERNLFCRYFISGQIYLSTTVKRIENTTLDTTFYLGENIRNILKHIENHIKQKTACKIPTSYTYEKDFLWWVPKKVFRKRDFIKVPFNYENGVISKIPRRSNKETNFFGFIVNPNTKVPSLSFKITDGKIKPNTLYYAKVTINLENFGFKYSDIQSFENIFSPLQEEEFNRLKIIERSNEKLNFYDYKETHLNTCKTFYIPFSISESDDDSVEWFNYIEFSSHNEDDPLLSITPIGLMNYFINSSKNINRTETNIYDEIVITAKNWTYKEWNEFFDNNIFIEFIAEEVPTDKYKLFQKFCLIPSFQTTEGSELCVTFNHIDDETLTYKGFKDYCHYVKYNGERQFEFNNLLRYPEYWFKNVYHITLRRTYIPRSYYDIVSDGEINFKEDALKTLSLFSRSKIIAKYFFDDIKEKMNFISDKFNYNIKNTIEYIPYESDENRLFYFNNRKPNSLLAFHSYDDVYKIEPYKNIYVFKPNTQNTFNILDYKKSGSLIFNEKENKINPIQFNLSHQSNLNKLYVINKNSNIFELETKFIFDEILDTMPNYNGKKFEILLLGKQTYNKKLQKYILSSYFFVGVGVYNFDLALGYAYYNEEKEKIEHTFLAGFGDYNIRNIKADTWYKLKVQVNENYIQVFFNEEDQPYLLAFNYYLKDYLSENVYSNIKGDFENIVYLITGLEKNSITYPIHIGNKTTSEDIKNIFNEEVHKKIKTIGNINGIVFSNNFTYVKELNYYYKDNKNYAFSYVNDATDLYFVIKALKHFIKDPLHITFIGRTLSNTLVIIANNTLFYKLNNSDVEFFAHNVKYALIKDEFVIIVTKHKQQSLLVVDQNFKKVYNLYVKDLYFNVDHIFNYLKYTNRIINNVWVTKNKLYISFEKKCLVWNEPEWNVPVWGCFSEFDDQCLDWNEAPWNIPIWGCFGGSPEENCLNWNEVTWNTPEWGCFKNNPILCLNWNELEWNSPVWSCFYENN